MIISRTKDTTLFQGEAFLNHATNKIKLYHILDHGRVIGIFAMDKVYSKRIIVHLKINGNGLLTKRIWDLICLKIRRSFHLSINKRDAGNLVFLIEDQKLHVEDIEIHDKIILKQC